jgi:hypothetical protein
VPARATATAPACGLKARTSDENGSGSAVADFPNGGVVVIVGNLLHKGARGRYSTWLGCRANQARVW